MSGTVVYIPARSLSWTDIVGARLGCRLGKGCLAWSSSLELVLLSSVFSWSPARGLSVIDGLSVGGVHSLELKSVSDSAVDDGTVSKMVETEEYWDELVEVRERTALHMRGGQVYKDGG